MTEPSYHSGKDLHVNLIIMATGTGMTKANLLNNLWHYCQSSTKAAMEALQAGADVSKAGQFVVDFYSACFVAVVTKQDGDGLYTWASSAGASCIVKADAGKQGAVEQRLPYVWKKTKPEYLEERRTEEVVKKHPQFIGFVEKKWEKKVGNDEAKEKGDKEEEKK